MKINFSIKSVTCYFIAMFFALSNVAASGLQPDNCKQDSVIRSSSMYFKFDVSSKIDSINHLEMGNLVFWVRSNSDAKINIYGWTDKAGPSAYNKILSFKRAKTAKKYLIENGVEADRIEYKGMGIDYESPRDVVARRSTIMAVKYVDKEEKVQEVVQPAEKEEQPQVEESSEPMISKCEEPREVKERGKFSLRTNLLYWAVGSANIGFEWIPANSSVGFIVNGGYAPLGGDHWKKSMGGWFVSPEIRHYLGENNQWFLGTSYLAGGYNYKLGDTGYQGKVMSGGLTGGYRIELSKTFDMDFSLGLGYGTLKYDRYYNNGDINIRTDKGVYRETIMPVQAGISLIWKIR